MLMIQKYVRAQSLQEAYDLNQNKRNRVLGGMLWLKQSDITVPVAIDLCDLGLDTIEEDETSFSIGAMVTLRQLEQHAGLNAYTQGAVARAVQDIVGVQFRNMATVGGSIFGRFGFSDILTIFQAMDACVELCKGGIMPLEEFAKTERDRDILVRLIVKKKPGCFAYQTVRNSRTDFPVLTCAAAKVAGEYRLVYGARPGRAVVLRDMQRLLAGGVDGTSAKAFAEFAAAQIRTGSNVRAGAEYRTHLVRVLTERTLMELEDLEHGN